MKLKLYVFRILGLLALMRLLYKAQKYSKKKTTMKVLLSLMAVSIAFSSCQYKDFDDYDGNVCTMVVMDWSGLDSTVQKPATMKVVFYPFYGGMQPFSMNVTDSAMIYMPTGQYRVFAYNDDSSILRVSGTDSNFETPLIYTDKADYRGLFAKDSTSAVGSYYDYPDRTFTDYTGCAITEFTDNRIVLKPVEVTRDVEVIVDGIRSQDAISSVRISLDGIVGSYSPLAWTRNYISVVSDADLSPSGNRITSSFHVYGLDRSVHTLQLFIMGHGFRRLLSFDVSEQANAQIGSSGKIIIHVTADYDARNDVPVDATSGIGVGVDDWPSEDIPIDF